jgi:hypothetical protein
MLDSGVSSNMADATSDGDQQTNGEVSLLARLLGDNALRQRFIADSQQVTRELTDDPGCIEFLASLDHLQLENQAETLVAKRQHEVAQLLPETWKRPGGISSSLFKSYAAESDWPDGHNRHLKDAESFGTWLVGHAKGELVMTELHRVRFLLSRRRLEVRIVRGGLIGFQLQILFRQRGGRLREVTL